MSHPDGFARFDDSAPLGDAREWLRERLDDGALCPCCHRLAKVYERPLTSVATRALIALYKEHGRAFGHMPDVARKHLSDVTNQGGYLVLTAHWGLMVEEKRRRPDGGRTGYWAVTGLGEDWLLQHTTVPRYARIFAGRCLGTHGPQVTVVDALGDGFDFGHLMHRAAPPDPDVLPGMAA